MLRLARSTSSQRPHRPENLSYFTHTRFISHFRVREHTLPAQHTRHWPRGTEIGYENALQLAVKQYVPLSNPNPRSSDITFIAAHANGFPKVICLPDSSLLCGVSKSQQEMYEPLFEDLHEKLSKLGRKIRAIWIADIAHQGQSGILNEDALGNDRMLDHKT